MTLRVEDCIGKWVKFTQVECGEVVGYVDKAFVASPYQVYLNTKDNPKCRPDSGYKGNYAPEWADYGWYMNDSEYKDLQLIEDMGEW